MRFLPTVARRALAGSLSASLGGLAVAILNGVALARLLGPESRGLLALLLVVPQIIEQVGALGLPAAVSYFVARRALSRRGVFSVMAAPVLLQTAVLLGFHGLALHVLSVSRGRDFELAGSISLVMIPGLLAQDYGQSLLQGAGRFASFNFFRFLPAWLTGLASVTMIAFRLSELPAAAMLMFGALATSGLVTLLAALAPSRMTDTSGPAPPLRQIIRFGTRTLFGSMYPMDTFRIDQALVGLFLSPIALGYYTIALTLSSLPRLISQAFAYIAYPNVASSIDSGVGRKMVWHFFWPAVGLSTAAVVGLEAIAPFLISGLFGSAFAPSIQVAQILLVGALCLAARRVLGEGLKGAGYPALCTLAEVSSWICFVPLMVVLGSRLGIYGFAAAVSLSSAVGLGTLVVANRTGGISSPVNINDPLIRGNGAFDL